MLCFLTAAFAQEFPLNPELSARVGYQQINVDNYAVIFPIGASEDAKNIANFMALYGPQIRHTGLSKTIPIVVQPYMATSNAFVSFFPRRSVFFTQPYMSTDPSKMGTSLAWTLALSVHELQHVEQQERSYEAGGRGLYALFGETGWGLVTAVQPIWSAEGEAVLTETRLTPSGRGRSFGFVGQNIAVYEHYENLSYAQSYFGSFALDTVDHYRIGWILTKYGNTQYGDQFWPSISRYASSNAFRFYPFERAIENTIGLRYQLLHDKSFEQTIGEWREAIKDKVETQTVDLFEETDTVASFQSPILTPSGQIVAQRSSYDRVDELVVIADGAINTRISVGQRNASNIGVNEEWVVWDATVNHPLHSGVRYSDLYAYGLKTKETKKLTTQSYLFAPAIGPKNKLVAIQQTPSGSSAIAVFDLNKTEKKLRPTVVAKSPEGTLYDPHWESETSIIVIRREQTKGNILSRYALDTGKWEDIGYWTWDVLSHPTSNSDWIFVLKSQPHWDDVIALPKTGGPEKTAVHRMYGVRDPSYDPETESIVFSEVTHSGSKISSAKITPDLWDDRPASGPAEEIVVPDISWEIKPYRAFLGVLKPYAWTPNLSLLNANLGVDINTQDATGRWLGQQGVLYNVNSGGLWGQTAVTATRPWPNIKLESIYGRRFERDLNQIPEDTGDEFKISDLPSQQWREQLLLIGLDFPISFSRSQTTRDLTISIKGGVQRADDIILSDQETVQLNWPLGISHPLLTALNARNLKDPAVRDIFPRWGQELNITHQRLYGDQSLLTTSQFASAQLYLPGVFKHQHLLLYGAMEKKTGNYPIPYQSRMARGHLIRDDELLSFNATYAFPFAYPDWVWRRIMYVKRLRGGLFADATLTDDRALTFGASVSVDAHLFQLPILLPFGIDIGYSPTLDQVYVGPNIDLLY